MILGTGVVVLAAVLALVHSFRAHQDDFTS